MLSAALGISVKEIVTYPLLHYAIGLNRRGINCGGCHIQESFR
jgi:hypothetical protein